jgi:hypothetical protein
VIVFEYPALFEMKGEAPHAKVDIVASKLRRKGGKVRLVT